MTFRNNDGFQGGAISTIGPVGDEGVQENRVGVLSITNSIFESNHAGFLGGAVLAESQGGTTITGSLFADNRAEGEGGAVWLAALDGSTVNDSEFSGNSSTYAGGAASLIGPTSIVGSDFTDNNSGDGGAVYFNAWFPGEVGGVEIGDTTFSDNSASYGGGAISLPEPDTDYYPIIQGFEVTVENSTLTRNTSDGPGGAILNFQELDIVGTTISYNTAQDGGGGVTTYANTTFSRSSVIANTSVDGAAGISLRPWEFYFCSQYDPDTDYCVPGYGGDYYLPATVSLTNSTVAENTSANSVGGIESAETGGVAGIVNLTFATVAGNVGGAGQPSQISQAPAVPNTPLNMWGSVIASSDEVEPLCSFSVSNPFWTSFATDGSCFSDPQDPTADQGRIATWAELDLQALAGNGSPGSESMLPGLSSPLVTDGAAGLELEVESDQVGAPRPWDVDAGFDRALSTVGSRQAVFASAPEITLSTPGSEQATLVFTVPDVNWSGEAITRYEYSLDGGDWEAFDPSVAVSPGTITGLTNGTTYSVRVRAVYTGDLPSLPSSAVNVTPQGSGPVPPPASPPSAPRDVAGVAGDRQVVVSWLPPASQGSFPVTNYRVTAVPGGQGCLVAAPTLSCTVTGLTNGTAYTFSVAALNGAGWGPSGVSGPVTPTPAPGPTPAPPPQDLPEPLGPGESLLLTDGVPDPNVVVEPNAGDNGLNIVGDDWAMDLDGLDPFGNPLNLGPDGVLILNQQRDVQTSGRGFLGDSEVDLYVFVNQPPTGAGTSADRLARVASAGDPVYVGTVRTTQAGTFGAQLRLPASIPPGVHTLQAVGWSPQRTTRAMNLGVLVAPWIVLDQGTRSADGRHDRIRTGGSTGGIDPGVRLTPWIRYAGQGAFKEGRAVARHSFWQTG